jgi:cytochrome c553
VTAECFVEALDRPLQIEATRSKNSVQPAVGERSPRIFLRTTDALVIAVVIDGDKRDLVEFSQFITPKRSVKAELQFPLEAPATVAAALQRVRNPEHPRITSCFVCHDRERDEPTIPGGRSSLALRPSTESLVGIDALQREHETCDDSAEPDRCRWLEALVSHGPLVHRPFDQTLRVF